MMKKTLKKIVNLNQMTIQMKKKKTKVSNTPCKERWPQTKIIKTLTDDSFVQNQDKLLDDSNKGYVYSKIPTPNLKSGSALTSYKEWLKDMNDYRVKQRQYCNVAV